MQPVVVPLVVNIVVIMIYCYLQILFFQMLQIQIQPSQVVELAWPSNVVPKNILKYASINQNELELGLVSHLHMAVDHIPQDEEQ